MQRAYQEERVSQKRPKPTCALWIGVNVKCRKTEAERCGSQFFGTYPACNQPPDTANRMEPDVTTNWVIKTRAFY